MWKCTGRTFIPFVENKDNKTNNTEKNINLSWIKCWTTGETSIPYNLKTSQEHSLDIWTLIATKSKPKYNAKVKMAKFLTHHHFHQRNCCWVDWSPSGCYCLCPQRWWSWSCYLWTPCCLHCHCCCHHLGSPSPLWNQLLANTEMKLLVLTKKQHHSSDPSSHHSLFNLSLSYESIVCTPVWSFQAQQCWPLHFQAMVLPLMLPVKINEAQ